MTDIYDDPDTGGLPAATAHNPSQDVLDAEAAVAGAAICGRHFAEAAAEIVTPDHFHQPHCAVAFAAALHLAGAGKWVDGPAVVRHLEQTGGITAFGRQPVRVYDLARQGAVGLEGVRHHAQTVTTDAARRAMWQACHRGMRIASAPTFELTDSEMILADVQAATSGRPDAQALLLADDFDDYLESLEKPDLNPVLPTPWVDLNAKVRVRGGQLVVIGARPGGGKSLAGLGIATHTAIKRRHPAALFSLEMPRAQITDRVMAAEARVSLTAFEERQFSEWDWNRIAKVTNDVRSAPLIIDDAPQLTVAHVRTRLRWMAGQGIPAAVVVIDYLQLMKATGRHESRVAAVGEISRDLKQLAIEFNVPVVALTQLNRASEARSDKRPAMSDLRESGAIENDADIVLLLHRPPAPTEEERNESVPDRSGEVDVLVEKQRQGINKIDIPLAWQAHYARLANLGKD